VSESFSETVCGCDERRRTLKSIAAFSEKRAKRSTIERARKKQVDADEIKTREKELNTGYERVSVVATPTISCAYKLMLIADFGGHQLSHCRRASSHS
jgi:hypothetical protein